jgi:hypothetical protein
MRVCSKCSSPRGASRGNSAKWLMPREPPCRFGNSGPAGSGARATAGRLIWVLPLGESGAGPTAVPDENAGEPS